MQTNGEPSSSAHNRFPARNVHNLLVAGRLPAVLSLPASEPVDDDDEDDDGVDGGDVVHV